MTPSPPAACPAELRRERFASSRLADMPDPIRDDFEARLLLIFVAYAESLSRVWERSLAILGRQEGATRNKAAPGNTQRHPPG